MREKKYFENSKRTEFIAETAKSPKRVSISPDNVELIEKVISKSELARNLEREEKEAPPIIHRRFPPSIKARPKSDVR